MTDSENKYRVLARKYRPLVFADLIGQEALVRTLKNSLETGRLAQAYILTGIRGVGKTTSARIIAKALNCIGADGKGGMTPEPCGVCEHCRAIAAGSHIDVMEIDAASNTGVDNVREIIETTRYAPTSARFKVYIVDEVHMLSKAAFNALLKTLEEPPACVKFIFATTEIRKVPATILSRCQRFDLRRVEPELLFEHFKNILKKENLTAEDDALRLIAKAADGSVRDGLSVLDQAIAHSGGTLTTEFVRQMIGLADKTALPDLYNALAGGKIAEVLDLFENQYALGADPVVFVQDLLELTHFLTRAKITPSLIDEQIMSADERDKCKALATALPMSLLARMWQMLLKGVQEISTAPSEKQAVEMLLIRLAYMADLPSPRELAEKLRSGRPPSSTAGEKEMRPPSSAPSGSVLPAPFSGNVAPAVVSAPREASENRTFLSLADVVEYALTRDPVFAFNLRTYVSLTKFEQGKIEFYPLENAPKSLAADVQRNLSAWTGKPWLAVVSSQKGGLTLKEQADRQTQQARQRFESHPVVAKIVELFPNAKIADVRLIESEKAREENETDSSAESEEGDE